MNHRYYVHLQFFSFYEERNKCDATNKHIGFSCTSQSIIAFFRRHID